MSNKKILIIEDEEEIIIALKLRLTSSGFNNISVATDGETGWNKILDEKPDLIILDLIIPKIDGYEVCKRVKESSSTKHIPVIIVSAKGMVKDLDKALSLGANDYLIKPYDWKLLLEKINKY